MNKFIVSALLLSAATANAQQQQVGINTAEPKATLHVEAGASENKGVIIPRITAAEMKAMTTGLGADHHSMMTYLKEDLPSADQTGKLAEVTEAGYYFYNHSAGKWQKFGGSGEQDLRAVETTGYPGSYNHLTKDAGIGGNGTSLGEGGGNIGIGQETFHFANSSDMQGNQNIGIGVAAFQFRNGATMSSTGNIGIGAILYSLYNGGSMSGGGYNIGMGMDIYTSQKTNAQFTGGFNTGIGSNLFKLQNGDLTGSANIGIGKGLFKLQSGNLIGDNNIGIGYNSYVVQTGDMSYNAKHNIALGTDVYNSGGLFTVGYSIGIGYEVFNAAGGISGLDNIAIGKRAMRANVGDISGFNNIAIGTEAMRNSLGHIVGANNIAVGNNALRVSNGDTGKYNIAIGDWALGANDMGMGNGNIQIGNMNEAPPVTGRRNNVVAIGNKMGDIDSSVPDNVILLGAKSGTTNSPRVGVGIYQPRAKLDVAGEIRIGTEGNACTSVNEGAIRYVRTYKLFQGCNGTSWVNLN